MASTLDQPHYQDPNKAREYLEAVRWPDGPVCPHCGSISQDHYALQGKAHRPGLWKCKDCRSQFSVTVGTVFERSKVPLHQWLQAVYLICSSKKGISSHQLQRSLGVQYRTAWFMSHRIRTAMDQGISILGDGSNGSGTVEVDETYIGRKPYRNKRPGASHKNAVVSLIERGGKVRSIHVPRVNVKNLKPILDAHLSKNAVLMTDEAGVYRPLGPSFAEHRTVNHSAGEYVRGHAYTNTVENFFSIMKRGIYGVYHHVSEQHLQRYCHEYDFRYNYRETKTKVNGKWVKTGFTDKQRTDAALKGISGKRLTYR